MFRICLLFSAILFLLVPAAFGADTPVRDHDIVPEDYFDIGTVFVCEISQGGQYAAYMESRWGRGKEGRKNDLWVVDLSTRERRRLTFDGFGPGHITWGPGDRWIYFTGRVKRGGETKPPHDGSTQVWRISPDGTDPLPVTRVKKGIRTFALSGDGGTLYYTTVKEIFADEWKELRKEFSDLEYGHGISKLNVIWKLDLTSWRTTKILDADRVIREMTLSPDDGKLALITTTDNEAIFREGWSDLDILDVASGAIERVTPPGWRGNHPSPYGWIGDASWADDGDALAFSLSFDGYATQLCVVEWIDGKATLREVERPHPAALDGAVQWRGTSRTLCFRGEDRARVRVYAINGVKDGGQGEAEILTPGDVAVGAFSFDASGERLAVVIETVDSLNDIHLIEGDESKQITNLNPQAATWKMPQISVFSWTGADGDQVDGILELPPGYSRSDGPLPLIVELHGGPTACTKLRLRLWIYGRALMAAKGYALISPNYHGSTGYGDEFTKKLVGRENDIEIIDIRTGIEALVKEGIADRERLGVMGWSNGGFLTNSMITAEPALFKAASSGAGVLDQVLQWAIEDTPGHVINYMEGLPWEKPEEYMKGSPLYKLDRVKTPTLIHVGGGDPRVPAAHSRALYRALHHYVGVPVELVVYPGEAHGLSTYENRLAKMKWDLAWFDKYLLGNK
jgi:dipeptidyl aminopeptidase/acylaminoacyl peptidase